MKKMILLISVLFLMSTVNVRAEEILFTICDADGTNCVDVSESESGDNHEYDNFTLQDGTIYLNNANITMKTNYRVKINVTGNNKITNFENTTNNGISVGEEYIPFEVVGDGSLEIEKYAKYNTNDVGEIYYKYGV